MPFKSAEKKREYQRVWYAKRRAYYVAEAGGVCMKCEGTSDLEFHHRDPKDKFTHRIWSLKRERIEAELAKCDLLCRDCHLDEHGGEWNYRRING